MADTATDNDAAQDTGTETEPATEQATTNQDATQTDEQATTNQDATQTDEQDTRDGGKTAVLADLARERDARQGAEQQAQTLKDSILKALGVSNDDEEDPVKAVETYKSDAQQARAELAVYRAAGAAGADPDALLDSASFLKALAGIDPTDGDKVAAAIKTAVENNPRYAAEKAAPAATRDATAKSDHTSGASPDDWIRAAVRGRS